MTDQPTTDRAQRQQAAASGARTDAVDRLSGRTDPRGRGSQTSPRARQIRAASGVADEIDIGRGGVGTVDRLGSGLDVFLRSGGADAFADRLRSDFASDADFVQPDDVAAEVDPEDITGSARVAQERRDDVADRARQQAAADAQFIEPADLGADVGPRGVSDLRVRGPRRDDVADRVRSDLASDNPFTRPSDFEATVTATGVEQAGFAEGGRRRAAARQFESETLLGDVDPSGDVTERENGFGLDQQAQQRAAAEQLERDTPFDDLDPDTDVRETGDGFGLTEGPRRELAADRLADQTALSDVNPQTDLTGSGEGFALDQQAQQRAAAEAFEGETPFDDLGPSDVTIRGGQAELVDERQRELGARQLDEQLPDQSVTASDVQLEETDDGLRAVFEEEVRA